MPPVAALEDYLELVAAVEATAAALGMPVLLEGYPPPHDPRLRALHDHARSRRHRGQHPAGRELGRAGRAHDDALRGGAADAAHAPRSSCSTAATPAPAAAITSCSAAPTPADSPFLRRPDLLRSLVAYWHNHPSLSYLFSGLLHRPDEPGAARRRGAPRQPLRARDRVRAARAGRAARRRRGSSTARSAICSSTSPATRIAPSSASTSCTRPTRRRGRRGLLELRAFEMPPHARMSLAQQLLLRALVARFWREPYTAPLDALGHGAARSLHAAVLRRGSISRT